MRTVISSFLVGALSLFSISAFATVSAVTVETWGNTSTITLSQICGSSGLQKRPIGVSCEVVADPGSGASGSCGTGACKTRVFDPNDAIGLYCQDTVGNDAIVFCTDNTSVP